MNLDERRSPDNVQHVAHQAGRTCPFCSAPAAGKFCGSCGRDTNAPRRPCVKCRRMIPSHERACWNCGATFKSDMRWKVPLIVFLFLLAFVVSVLLALLS